MIQTYNRSDSPERAYCRLQAADGATRRAAEVVQLQPAFLYNPGLVDSWFIVTGVFGLLLILNSSLVASGAMVKEREAGTIEQLLMSPASTSEIIIAKIAPLFVLLCMTMLYWPSSLSWVAFGVPFHGSLLLVLCGAALCILSGISLGTVIATFSKSAQQAQLTGFFVNPPLTSLSGALNPVEAMPRWLQPITVFNPIHHFATLFAAACSRAAESRTLWPNFLGLLSLYARFCSR